MIFENKTEHTRLKIILNIFWARIFEFSKRAKAPSSLVIKINQRFHQELFSWTATGALIWLREFFHWFDHQTKPSIPFLYYFCNLLYRSACIAWIVIILSLYWRLFCCELPGLVILFCTVGSVQAVTCCRFQQGCSWNTQCFLFCCGFNSGLLQGAVRRFWVIQWILYNCDLLWVSARELLKHTVNSVWFLGLL